MHAMRFTFTRHLPTRTGATAHGSRTWFRTQCTGRPVGRDSSVDIATRYRLHGQEMESQWGQDFPHPSRPNLGLPIFLYDGYRFSFPEVNRPGRGFGYPLKSSAEVKERVEVYICSTSGPSWPLLGSKCTALLHIKGLVLALDVFLKSERK
jgi:hypothetical protein